MLLSRNTKYCYVILWLYKPPEIEFCALKLVLKAYYWNLRKKLIWIELHKMRLKSCWESCVHYYHNTWGEFWNEIFGSSSEEWLMWVSIFAWCELNGPRTQHKTE